MGQPKVKLAESCQSFFLSVCVWGGGGGEGGVAIGTEASGSSHSHMKSGCKLAKSFFFVQTFFFYIIPLSQFIHSDYTRTGCYQINLTRSKCMTHLHLADCLWHLSMELMLEAMNGSQTELARSKPYNCV